MHAGVVVASATAGVLFGFAWRLGMPARPFNAAAALLLGDRALGVWGFAGDITLIGAAVHVAWSMAVGLLFALVATRLRSWALLLAALLFAGALLLSASAIAPPHLRAAAFPFDGIARLMAIYITLGAALAVGIRIARPSMQQH